MFSCQSSDRDKFLVDRVMASNLLLIISDRCRNNDVRHIYEILYDHSKEKGFIEITTRHYKGAKNAQKKAILMPILMDSNGICADDWLEHWIRNRQEGKCLWQESARPI